MPRAAWATSIQYSGYGKNDLVEISLSGVWTSLTLYAGELNWTITGTPPAGYAPAFYAYSADLASHVQSAQNVAFKSTDFLTVSGVPDAGRKAAWLYNAYHADIHTTGSNQDAAALQIAIWEALYDESASLTSGSFRLNTDTSVRTRAMEYLTALYSGPTGYSTSSAGWLDTNLGQDLVGQMPVPEPTTLALLGAGLAGIRQAVRRRRSRAAPSSTPRPGCVDAH